MCKLCLHEYIPHRQKFSPGKYFSYFHLSLSWAKFLSRNLFKKSPFYWMGENSAKYFCNAMVAAGLIGQNFWLYGTYVCIINNGHKQQWHTMHLIKIWQNQILIEIYHIHVHTLYILLNEHPHKQSSLQIICTRIGVQSWPYCTVTHRMELYLLCMLG